MGDGTDRVAVVCVRDSRRYGLQVLLSRDAAAGCEDPTWFSEGDVETSDHSPEVLERCYGLTGVEACRLLGHGMTPAPALGCWVAAVRVLYAATRVLYAVEGRHRTRVPRVLRLRGRRSPHHAAPELASYLTGQNCFFDLTRLLVFSRWNGAGTGVKRFFLASLPDDIRVAGFVWLRPEGLLTRWRDQGLSLDFSTFISLRSLSDFSSCAAVLSEYDTSSLPRRRPSLPLP
ncbi:MAG: hypothetical protein OXN22_12410 [Deltaproteobacteria bacterium]|nr:hypothetical protein [Deltaproteobacteria bacterium]